MKYYYDSEHDEIISSDELMTEYEERADEIAESCNAHTYAEWIACVTGKDGSLEDLSNADVLERVMRWYAEQLREYDRFEYPWSCRRDTAEKWNTIYPINTTLGNDILCEFGLL